ncbi:hypothetical protein Trco_008511 [Trichoderma cornu-damae]|uniref:Uncharacterized protein n=1 Tax=Trichoderma cornu-damae TaxID=654480 RepID=A0A9P8QFL1_9HYPO|nr:hypothetical protein Trco_008511 [Trichoderma cornu-damae]
MSIAFLRSNAQLSLWDVPYFPLGIIENISKVDAGKKASRNTRSSPVEAQSFKNHVLLLATVPSTYESHRQCDNFELFFKILNRELYLVLDKPVYPQLPLLPLFHADLGRIPMVSDIEQILRSKESGIK